MNGEAARGRIDRLTHPAAQLSVSIVCFCVDEDLRNHCREIDVSGEICSFTAIFSILGATMYRALGRLLTTAVVLGCALSVRPSLAADLGLISSAPVGTCSELVFTCENGKQYPLCPIAVSVAGEVVTASLHTGHGATHVRLVPMGVGYRYAGRGVWLDGFGENALLNFGKHSQIACTLAH